MKKYKVFWYEIEEPDNDWGYWVANIYYNGTLATKVKAINENILVSEVKEWVDSEGFYWLGME